MREEEKIFSGVLFNPGDPELKAIKLRSHKLSATVRPAKTKPKSARS